jgi:hypothetical protein
MFECFVWKMCYPLCWNHCPFSPTGRVTWDDGTWLVINRDCWRMFGMREIKGMCCREIRGESKKKGWWADESVQWRFVSLLAPNKACLSMMALGLFARRCVLVVSMSTRPAATTAAIITIEWNNRHVFSDGSQSLNRWLHSQQFFFTNSTTYGNVTASCNVAYIHCRCT